MSQRTTATARAAALCLVLCLAIPMAARAQSGAGQDAIVPGERLSDWLLRNAGPNGDATALHWRVPAERLAQGQLRQAVVTSLQQGHATGLSAEARTALADWLLAMPLTGRLTVRNNDARWLQAAPADDPVLQDGHQVLLFARPSTVTVVTESAQPCLATHVPGALVRDYLRACAGAGGGDQADWAWIAQPDGRTARFGIAAWSIEPQDEPAPGAWIWAPGRAAGIPPATSDNLARFLATQVPGEQGMPTTPAPRPVERRTATDAPPRPAQYTSSDWGEIGLLQTPTARMAPTGAARLHFGRIAPYKHANVMLQPLDWLETGFRYSEVENRLSGPIAGTQKRKDKSIDFKIRLREESDIWPQLALGVRDLGGTGLFAAEYLVASKRWGNWDASLGLGWGYLGARGNVRNPFTVFGDKYGTRPRIQTLTGGEANLQSMFRGPAALFGGLQWHSPYDPWIFKIELDGNDYQSEPLNNNLPARSPFNIGAVYRYSPNIDISLGVERGNRLMLGFTVHGGLDTLYAPKLLDPVAPAVQAQAPGGLPPQGWGTTAQAIALYTGWSVREITHQHDTTTVLAETDTAVHLQERIERAVMVLHRDAPASSTRLVLRLQERGLPMSQIAIDRAEWVAQHTRVVPPALRLPAQQAWQGQASAAVAAAEESSAGAYWRGRESGLSLDWGPSYSQVLGGPDNFLLYQLGLQGNLEYRFADNTWLSGAFNLRLLDNYDKFTYTAPSDLPRVRTLQREYATTARLTMPLLQLTHVRALGGGHYVSAYGGMLEHMYGGVGAEWLYRPWQGRMAWGIDINHVRQRDFRQGLAFRDYSVNTGHAALYWDTGWNDVQVKLSAGRYLAGDVGATLDVRRVFPNGVALGAWATKTNVSAARFGEGSFDKGIYVSLPFDVMLPMSTPTYGSLVWNPLTRDGGARLNRRFPLYDLTRQRDGRALQWRSAGPTARASAEDASYVLSEPAPGLLQTLGPSAATLGQQISDIPASTWLWAGSAVLASSLLDKRADRWAVRHQAGRWNSAGSATNAMPYALAAGVGLLYTGIAGDAAASTAQTAIKAGVYTLGANLATRFVVGRSRPTAGQGAGDFNGLDTSAFKSGFTSSHVAVAFALVTPFAQQHDMPWLYGLAAATAFGRIQKREHWLSDTVAGAFMGYAIGSLLSDQQRGEDRMRLSISPQSVVAHWAF